ncbi:hypothetical protein [Herbidospora cretacea]|uniref:hypothetical protein n=1 Tax=Herbidospora cretacea TaxID=28444 RepID=UPI000AD1CA4D|nr:hypothetical protein [Herbidospora cretacea]
MVGASALALARGGVMSAGAEIKNMAGQTIGSLQVEEAGTGKSRITVCLRR